MAGRFGAVVTAMVTPFRDDHGLDLDAARSLAAHLYERGSDSLVIAGSTGESPTLTHREKLDLFEAVIDVAKGNGQGAVRDRHLQHGRDARAVARGRGARRRRAPARDAVLQQAPAARTARALHAGRERRLDPGRRVQHPRADRDPHRTRHAAADRRGPEHRRREGLDRRLPVDLEVDLGGLARLRGLQRRRLGDVRLHVPGRGRGRLGGRSPRGRDGSARCATSSNPATSRPRARSTRS